MSSLITNSIGMKLVLIPAGSFMMGSPESEPNRLPNEGPQHQVVITKPFYLGVYPITQKEYLAVIGTNPSVFNEENGGEPEHPVEYVSWDDAWMFCRDLSQRPEEMALSHKYRLPTEAEWEYACRAGTTTPFYFGTSLTAEQANFGRRLKRTTAVGSYPPNAFGLYDMHGQVWEWCKDRYKDTYYHQSPREDPQGPGDGNTRVLRGGSQGSGEALCRSANRDCNGQDLRTDSRQNGFRVALQVPSAGA